MKESIKLACGKIAGQIFKGTSSRLADGTLIAQSNLEKMVAASLTHEAAKNGDMEGLRSHLSAYWQGPAGDAFYQSFTDRFEQWFLGDHYVLVEELKKMTSSAAGELTKLFEIGCGDGRVLNHLSEALDSVEMFTGLDINRNIIEQNRQSYEHKDCLQFESCDAAKWIAEHATAGSIVMTYGGVMEYFLETELVEMYTDLKAKSPTAVALVEPLYDGFDLKEETSSRASGLENSLSHNYPHLIKSAGFDIVFQKELTIESFRWLILVAKG